MVKNQTCHAVILSHGSQWHAIHSNFLFSELTINIDIIISASMAFTWRFTTGLDNASSKVGFKKNRLAFLVCIDVHAITVYTSCA
jgi:hypothetical protein